MSRYDVDEEDWDDEWIEDCEETSTITCPACGAEVYEESPACPVCGEYITSTPSTGSQWAGKPWWYVALALFGIFSVIIIMLF
jgi:predicted amidophosphoribosyltransferase